MKDKTIKVLGVIFVIGILFMIAATAVEAKTPTFTSLTKAADGEHWSKGHLYIVKDGRIQTGWVRYKENTYYCHKKDSEKYPRGSATRWEMRIRHGNKWFAFDGSGRMITENYYIKKGKFKRRLSLEIRKDCTVKYIYNTSACFGYRRYSTKERRYQEIQSDGRWKTVPSMQSLPDCIDSQE